MATTYRPKSDREFDVFNAQWCHRCARHCGCSLRIDAMFYDLLDPKYPAQWHYNAAGRPVCTAYRDKPAPPPVADRAAAVSQKRETQGQLRLL